MPENVIISTVDDILKKIGLPQSKPVADAIAPATVLTKIGIKPPGEMIEKAFADIESKLPSGGGLPKPPGLFR